MSDQTDFVEKNTNIVSRTLKEAFKNKDNAEKLLSDPSAVFLQNGLDIPHGHEKQFNNYFSEVAGDLVVRLRETPQSQLSFAHGELVQEAAFGIGCRVCKIAVYSIAAVLVALGAVGVARLTVGAPVVAALATFARVGRERALDFIRGLSNVVSQGVSAVADRICRWVRQC